MSKKEMFINELEELMDCGKIELSDEAFAYFSAMKDSKEKVKEKFTENGKIILTFMRENKNEYNNLFKSKDFEAAGLTSKTASGAMRKLMADGYISKEGDKPCIYAITPLGETVNLTV